LEIIPVSKWQISVTKWKRLFSFLFLPEVTQFKNDTGDMIPNGEPTTRIRSALCGLLPERDKSCEKKAGTNSCSVCCVSTIRKYLHRLPPNVLFYQLQQCKRTPLTSERFRRFATIGGFPSNSPWRKITTIPFKRTNYICFKKYKV
jgi:hypothetical protein